MWANLTNLNVSVPNLVLRASVVYIAVILLIRLSGKRELRQLGAGEFVAILLVSNAVQNSINGGDQSLIGGLISAVVIIFLSWVISVITFKSKKMRQIFEGSPILLVHNGKIIEGALAKERITLQELHTLLREQDEHKIENLRAVILEVDGKLSVIKKS